jgi:signal transduction histidine kinase
MVAIAEDSPVQAEILKRILLEEGFRVTVANNGMDLLSAIKNHKPALVITDIIMPNMNGFEVCRRIKEDRNLKDIPVILVTSLTDPMDVLHGLECSADDFIMKPYRKEYLCSQIKNLFYGRESESIEDADGNLEFRYGGKRIFVKTGRRQILNILVSTYTDAIEKKRQLQISQEEIFRFNEYLEQKVVERTRELEAEITRRKAVQEELEKKGEEIRTMTRQLWQATKLATMGELAASIAHELNNPLAIISLRVEAMMMNTPPEVQEYHIFEVISKELERMGTLVANLLQFSRRSHSQISTINLFEEITGTLELIHYHLKKRNINTVLDFPIDLPLIHADRQQIRQLFLNLFTNAGDAMPKGGTLTIRASFDGKIRIEVEDAGTGIAPEDLPKIMEPFFTTKEEGKGTGLGLSICRRIMNEHNGDIFIKSELHKGTMIMLIFPLVSNRNGNFLNS